MAEQHVKLLQGLGVDQAMIDEVEKLEADKVKDWTPDKVTSAVKNVMKTQFLEDADFLNAIPEEKIPDATKKKFESGQYTRFQKELLETATKQLGLEETDLADLTEEDKKSIKKTMVKIAEKHLTKKGNVQGLQQMQEQLRKANELLETKEAEHNTKLTAELEKVNGANSARLIKALVKGEIATSGLELTVPAGYITEPILAKLSSKYSIVVSESGDLELRQKANPALKVLDGSKEVSFAQALKSQLLEDKVAKEVKEEDPTTVKKKRVTVGNEGGEEEEFSIPDFIKSKVDKIQEYEK